MSTHHGIAIASVISMVYINLYNWKESILGTEVTKIGEKWLVLLILQG